MAKKKSSSKQSQKTKNTSRWGWHPAPLKGSFMVFAIVGFLTTLYLIYPRYTTWGVAFMIVFTAMFIASIISMTKAPVVE